MSVIENIYLKSPCANVHLSLDGIRASNHAIKLSIASISCVLLASYCRFQRAKFLFRYPPLCTWEIQSGDPIWYKLMKDYLIQWGTNNTQLLDKWRHGAAQVRKSSMVCLHNNAFVVRGILVNRLHCETHELSLSAIYIVSSVGNSLTYFARKINECWINLMNYQNLLLLFIRSWSVKLLNSITLDHLYNAHTYWKIYFLKQLALKQVAVKVYLMTK